LWEKISAELLSVHRGKFFGVILGLITGLAVMRFGFLWTAFIFVCTYVGYHIGKRVDENKENLVDIIERYLPPGDR
jgi:uncharacterized membrane protein